MGEQTAIQWTNHTWNPWRGCTKVSPGCKNCYMFSEQTRYGQDPSVVLRTKTWNNPHIWQRAAQRAGRTEMVFTCSWSDWFHADADQWRDEAWQVVKDCPNLIFQILTKRPERIKTCLPSDWGAGYPNVWLGTSVEDQQRSDERIPHLLKIPAKVRFLSVEPMLGPIQFREDHLIIDWGIFGGESGSGARPLNVDWVRKGVTQLRAAGVASFVKQLGANPYSYKLKDKKGGDMAEWPEDLRVREFPQ